MKKESRKKQDDRIDEHGMPTEPLPDISAMYFPPSNQSGFIPGGGAIQPPFVSYQDPEQPVPVYPYFQNPSPNVNRNPYYPSLPGAPLGTNYGVSPTATVWDPGNTKNQPTRRRMFLPACIGLFFFCVQLLLVVRFGIRFLSLSPDTAWVDVVINVSEIFILPFRELWLQIPLVSTLVPAPPEPYTLIAILLYGVLSRLLVGILKAILKSR